MEIPPQPAPLPKPVVELSGKESWAMKSVASFWTSSSAEEEEPRRESVGSVEPVAEAEGKLDKASAKENWEVASWKRWKVMPVAWSM